MLRAIDEYKITGIKTTLPFCKFVLRHEAFLDGSFTTKFVEDHFRPENLDHKLSEDEKIIGAIAGFKSMGKQVSQNHQSISKLKKSSNWKLRHR